MKTLLTLALLCLATLSHAETTPTVVLIYGASWCARSLSSEKVLEKAGAKLDRTMRHHGKPTPTVVYRDGKSKETTDNGERIFDGKYILPADDCVTVIDEIKLQ